VDNYTGHIIPYYDAGMVRLPLTPAEIERGKRLGAALRRARGERSMLDVALAARVSPETLRKVESGRIATPAFTTVAALACVLDLSLDALWAEIDEPARSSGEARSGRGPYARRASSEPELATNTER
jgi:transcriptional regulator with XRE-family HTH domain